MRDPFFMVVAIVFIVGAVSVAKAYLKSRHMREENTGPDEFTQRQIEQLEERVRVLETIVTDKKHDLRREIDSL